ncbi:hypothetical protein GTR02_02275 [Kineococcus sp. R8]|uniref:hypothetical protein n=1 Tax=Kineococcus siccus TaxID=2696567 RepID=UPI0014126A66|nr:hypothetical protein [Kineococcus siccus]NAZ80644.1 hypothetical protein [Kineococcus siccus]
MDDYRAWQVLAPSGLLLVGAGVSVAVDASTRRGRSGVARWAGQGTVGLVALNAGLCLFGEAVKRRALHDVAEREAHRRGPEPEDHPAG